MSAPIILIHGWASDTSVWQPCQALWPQPHTLPQTLSLPGYDVATMTAAEAQALWQAPEQALLPQLPAKCHLVGWSLGGNLAMAMAKAAPQQVASVTTIAAAPCFVANSQWPWAMPAADYERFAASFKANPAATLKRFRALQAKGDSNAKATTKALAQLPCDTNFEVLLASLEWLAAQNQCAYWQAPTVPHQALLAAYDALIPATAASALNTAAIVPACGHTPMLSQAPTLVAMMTRFIEGIV